MPLAFTALCSARFSLVCVIDALSTLCSRIIVALFIACVSVASLCALLMYARCGVSGSVLVASVLFRVALPASDLYLIGLACLLLAVVCVLAMYCSGCAALLGLCVCAACSFEGFAHLSRGWLTVIPCGPQCLRSLDCPLQSTRLPVPVAARREGRGCVGQTRDVLVVGSALSLLACLFGSSLGSSRNTTTVSW